ncbi:uncharacterized protein LOC108330357 [Vigna angularis]|uniref:uncharacterized protein LOC108330357 n=1 Tax=Phaseolus angularis TaxID=3914 RepID=UPI00080A4D7B|nr:uncharacterized protein LOC108330357 [Vigna angularis]
MQEMVDNVLRRHAEQEANDSHYEEPPNETTQRFFNLLTEENLPVFEGSTESKLLVCIRLMAGKSNWNVPIEAADFYTKLISFLVAEQVAEGNASARIHSEFSQWFRNQLVTHAVHPSPTPAAHPSTTPTADPLPPPVIITPSPPPVIITPTPPPVLITSTPLPDPTFIPSSSSIPSSETVTPFANPDSSGDGEGIDPPMADRPRIEPYGKG